MPDEAYDCSSIASIRREDYFTAGASARGRSFSWSQYGDRRRRFATMPGNTSRMRSTSASVLQRPKEKRTDPCTAVNGIFMAVSTCEGSSEPEVHADPLDAQIPASLS